MEGKAMQRILALVVLVVAVGGLVAWLAAQPARHRIYVQFKDAQGLKRGHKVLFRGVAVGEVTNVTLTPEGAVKTEVWLYEEHKSLIHAGATGRITQNSLVSVSGEKSIEMTNPSDQGSPIAAGTELQGVEGLMELKSWQLARWGEGIKDGAKAKASEWYDRATVRMNEMYAAAQKSLQGDGQDPDSKQFLDDLKGAADRRMKDFESELPEMQKRYDALYEKLKKRSAESAESLRRAWEEFRKGMEDAPAGPGDAK